MTTVDASFASHKMLGSRSNRFHSPPISQVLNVKSNEKTT